MVLDLEDGVATNQKQQARELIAQSLKNEAFGSTERVVRINSIKSGLGEADLGALVSSIDSYPFSFPEAADPFFAGARHRSH